MDIKKVTTRGELDQVIDISEIKNFITSKLKNPKEHREELLDDLKYLTGKYQRLLNNKTSGGWSKFVITQLFAEIVDALRSIGEEILVPVEDSKEYNTPYWILYRESQAYLKQPEIIEIEKPIEKEIKTFFISKKDKEEQIISSVVYSVDEPDSQNDQASIEDVKKAAYFFMEHSQTIKIHHQGSAIKVNLLENYLSPVDFSVTDITGGTQFIKKGTWIQTFRILSAEIFAKVKNGELTGLSMAGVCKIKP